MPPVGKAFLTTRPDRPPVGKVEDALMLVATMRSVALPFSTQSVIAVSPLPAKLSVAESPPQYAFSAAGCAA